MKKLYLAALLIPLTFSLSGCNILRYDSYDNSKSYTLIDGSIDFSVEQLDINKIDFDWGRGEVEVVTSDTGVFSFSESSEMEYKDNLKARYLISDKTLYIKYSASKATYNNKFSKKAVITINQNVEVLKNATYGFSVALGDLNVSSLNAQNLYMGVAYGNINSKDVTADKCRVLCDCGTQTHENFNIISHGELKTNYGDLFFGTSDEIKGFELNLNVVSGTVWVNTQKFPKESSTFYGVHQENDLVLDIIENYGNVQIL